MSAPVIEMSLVEASFFAASMIAQLGSGIWASWAGPPVLFGQKKNQTIVPMKARTVSPNNREPGLLFGPRAANVEFIGEKAGFL